MKRALIAASVGILASTVWVAAANAQADINRNIYPVTPGAQWQAGGPMKQGAMCRTDVDSSRGYGFMKGCPAPKAAASASTRALSARASAAPRAAAPTRKHKAVSSR